MVFRPRSNRSRRSGLHDAWAEGDASGYKRAVPRPEHNQVGRNGFPPETQPEPAACSTDGHVRTGAGGM
jgi:hypothetical protein